MSINGRAVKRNSTNKALKIAKDRAWSMAVRQRDGKCQWCGRKDMLQADHIFSRRMNSTRWNIDNGITLCRGCHIFKKKYEPMDWGLIVIEKLSLTKIKRLQKLHVATVT